MKHYEEVYMVKMSYETKSEIKSKILGSKVLAEAAKNGFENWYDFSNKIIVEVYGDPRKDCFDSISHMASWFAEREDIIQEILNETL